MERKRWDTAIHCLEIALHPNTTDDEVLAAVNGFRRTAAGTPLSRVCSEFAGRGHDGCDLAEWQDRLTRENIELRRQSEAGEDRETAAALRLSEAERRIGELGKALATAEGQAAEADRQLADFRAAYGRILDGVNQENLDLRAALAQSRRDTMDRPAPEAAASPFRRFLAEARQGLQPPPPAAALEAAVRQAPMDIGVPAAPPGLNQPWKA